MFEETHGVSEDDVDDFIRRNGGPGVSNTSSFAGAGRSSSGGGSTRSLKQLPLANIARSVSFSS